MESLIDKPTASCLLEVSKLLDDEDALGDDWRRLWSELLSRPLNEDVVKKKSESPTLFLLKRWCSMKPPGEATIGRLMKALNAIYRNNVARVLQRHVDILQQGNRPIAYIYYTVTFVMGCVSRCYKMSNRCRVSMFNVN